MPDSDEIFVDDSDRESFAAENEVLSKSGRAFSRYQKSAVNSFYFFFERSYARRNTLLAGDLIEEMNWRKSTLLIGRCGLPPKMKTKSWKTRLLNRLFGDIKKEFLDFSRQKGLKTILKLLTGSKSYFDCSCFSNNSSFGRNKYYFLSP